MSNIKVVEIWRRSRRNGYIFGLTSNTNSMLQKTWMKNYFNICMYVSRRMYRHVSQDTFMHEKTAAVLCASLNYRFADITDVSLLCQSTRFSCLLGGWVWTAYHTLSSAIYTSSRAVLHVAEKAAKRLGLTTAHKVLWKMSKALRKIQRGPSILLLSSPFFHVNSPLLRWQYYTTLKALFVCITFWLFGKF